MFLSLLASSSARIIFLKHRSIILFLLQNISCFQKSTQLDYASFWRTNRILEVNESYLLLVNSVLVVSTYLPAATKLDFQFSQTLKVVFHCYSSMPMPFARGQVCEWRGGPRSVSSSSQAVLCRGRLGSVCLWPVHALRVEGRSVGIFLHLHWVAW